MIKKTVWLSKDEQSGFCKIFRDVLHDAFSTSNQTIANLVTAINEQLSGLLGTPQTDNPVFEMFDDFLDSDATCNLWTDMPLYYSSYKFDLEENRLDRTIITRCQKDLEFYLAWFLKILKTDLSSVDYIRKFKSYLTTTNKQRTASSTASHDSTGTTKEDASDTPQLGQVDFDDNTLDYRSEMTRGSETGHDEATTSNQSSDTGTVSNEGDTSDTHVAQSFEEQRKQLAMRYFNDMVDRIYAIPQRIYDYYSVDVLPVGEAYSMLKESMRNEYI